MPYGEKLVKIRRLIDPEIIGLTGQPLESEESRPNRSKLENAWQSLAYSPLGAVVSPPSEYL